MINDPLLTRYSRMSATLRPDNQHRRHQTFISRHNPFRLSRGDGCCSCKCEVKFVLFPMRVKVQKFWTCIELSDRPANSRWESFHYRTLCLWTVRNEEIYMTVQGLFFFFLDVKFSNYILPFSSIL